MTELLVKAIEAVRMLEPGEQDAIAKAILKFAGSSASDPDEIDPDDIEDVQLGLLEAERGDFASEEEIEAAFSAFHG